MVIVRPLYVATTTVSLRDPLGLGLESMGAAVDSAAKRRYQAAVCPYQLPTVTAAADDISHLYDMFGPETKADRRTTVNGVVSEDDDEFVCKSAKRNSPLSRFFSQFRTNNKFPTKFWVETKWKPKSNKKSNRKDFISDGEKVILMWSVPSQNIFYSY